MKITLEKLKEIESELSQVRNEIIRYIENGNDYFTVSYGAWEVKFDATKLLNNEKGEQ